MRPVPPLVDEVLREWEFISFFAYDGFEAHGRGVVALEQGPEGMQAACGPREFFEQKRDPEILKLLAVSAVADALPGDERDIGRGNPAEGPTPDAASVAEGRYARPSG